MAITKNKKFKWKMPAILFGTSLFLIILTALIIAPIYLKYEYLEFENRLTAILSFNQGEPVTTVFNGLDAEISHNDFISISRMLNTILRRNVLFAPKLDEQASLRIGAQNAVIYMMPEASQKDRVFVYLIYEGKTICLLYENLNLMNRVKEVIN